MIGPHSLPMRIAYLLFCAGLILSFVAVDWLVGSMPVRSIFFLASLMTALLASQSLIIDIIQRYKTAVAVIVITAILGVLVSLGNGADIKPLLRQIIEIHVQAVVVLGVVGLLLDCFGLRCIIYTFLATWMFSVGFAILQSLDVDFGWNARALLGNLMNDPPITRAFYDAKLRATGLSFSPVHLATQTCLAFAAFCLLRFCQTGGEIFRRWDWPLLLAIIAAIIVCVSSGNRSPIVGFLIFFALYAVKVAARQAIVMLPLIIIGLVVAPNVLSVLDDAGIRVASTDDGSAIGRAALYYFGLLLFSENPLGYGLLFDSRNFANQFAHAIIHMDNAEIISTFSLHNYYLQMLNKYGIFVLAVIPLLIPFRRTEWLGWFCFLPYLIHVSFHNDGPLSSDFLFWIVLPLCVSTMQAIANRQGNPKLLPSTARTMQATTL